jgi:hypothetical protein
MLSCQVEFNRFLSFFLPSLKVIVEVRAIGLFFPFLSLSLSLSLSLFLKKEEKRKKKKEKRNEVKSLYGQVLIL